MLADEAGLDPGTALRRLERAVLARAGTTELLRVAAPHRAGTDRPSLTWVDESAVLRSRALPPLGRIVIGRGADCDVALRGDTALSRSHAAVEVDATGRATLRDLGSRNGTFHNGVRVPGDGAPLSAGDLVRCGTSLLAVVAAGAQAPAGAVDDATGPLP